MSVILSGKSSRRMRSDKKIRLSVSTPTIVTGCWRGNTAAISRASSSTRFWIRSAEMRISMPVASRCWESEDHSTGMPRKWKGRRGRLTCESFIVLSWQWDYTVGNVAQFKVALGGNPMRMFLATVALISVMCAARSDEKQFEKIADQMTKASEQLVDVLKGIKDKSTAN